MVGCSCVVVKVNYVCIILRYTVLGKKTRQTSRLIWLKVCCQSGPGACALCHAAVCYKRWQDDGLCTSPIIYLWCLGSLRMATCVKWTGEAELRCAMLEFYFLKLGPGVCFAFKLSLPIQLYYSCSKFILRWNAGHVQKCSIYTCCQT